MRAVLPLEDGVYAPWLHRRRFHHCGPLYRAGDAGCSQVKPATSFSGTLGVMVGVGTGSTTGISIVETGETSGLGSNAGNPDWQPSLWGRAASLRHQDGGRIKRPYRSHHHLPRVCESVTSALSGRLQPGLRRVLWYK